MAINYYRKVVREEHMLYACEIALKYDLYQQLPYNCEWNQETLQKKIGSLIHKYIKKWIKDVKLDYENYYFPSSKGLKIVYPFCIYDPAIRKYMKDIEKDFSIYLNKTYIPKYSR